MCVLIGVALARNPWRSAESAEGVKSYCFPLGLAALLHFITMWPGVLERRYFDTINTGLKFHLLILPSMGDFCPIPLSQWLNDFFKFHFIMFYHQSQKTF